MNILIFPFSLVVMFGKMLGNMRHAAVIYGVMMFMFVGMIVWGDLLGHAAAQSRP